MKQLSTFYLLIVFISAPCEEGRSEVGGGSDGDEDAEDLDKVDVDVQDVEKEPDVVLRGLDSLLFVLDPVAFVEGVHEVVVREDMAVDDNRSILEVVVDKVDIREDQVVEGRAFLDHDEEVHVLLEHDPFEVASLDGEYLNP